MSDAPHQPPLPFETREALGREDFYVTGANVLAVAQLDGWRSWPTRKMVLTGPHGSGKTHLARVWAAQADASVIAAPDLPQADIVRLAEGPVCVEDVDAIAGNRAAEEALFHLHNLVLVQGHALMLTACLPAARWPLQLADLKSRMMGAQAAQLSQPDDDLLSALLAKLFADRQIVPASDVIPYLTRHMPRSYRAAQRLVEELDDASWTRPKGVSRPLAVAVMERLHGPQTGDPGSVTEDGSDDMPGDMTEGHPDGSPPNQQDTCKAS